jgi:hypothetical protein
MRSVCGISNGKMHLRDKQPRWRRKGESRGGETCLGGTKGWIDELGQSVQDTTTTQSDRAGTKTMKKQQIKETEQASETGAGAAAGSEAGDEKDEERT